MSSVLNLIKNLPEVNTNNDSNLATDINYIRKSSMLVHDALQKGSDIMQLPNGDIIVTEVKTISYKYIWDKNKSKFQRATTGSKVKKRKGANDDV